MHFRSMTAILAYFIATSDLIGSDYAGAYITFSLTAWSLTTPVRIESSDVSTGRVYLSEPVTYSNLITNSKFIITNHIGLMKAGTWMYDESDNILYVYTSTGQSPENYTIEASTIDYGFEGNVVHNISINNIEIKGFNNTGIDIYGKSGQASSPGSYPII